MAKLAVISLILNIIKTAILASDEIGKAKEIDTDEEDGEVKKNIANE